MNVPPNGSPPIPPGYAAGGYVPEARGLLWWLDDAECVLDGAGRCTRSDVRHLRELVEVTRLGDLAPRYVAGRCLHRPCHVEPVESFDGAVVIARLCTACDQQLPA